MPLTIPDAIRPPMALTDEQRRAVEWRDGPLMVLAGAGTGKTTVVVERVRHLLDSDHSLAPENILVLTYNVRAAGELAERLQGALGVERAGRIWVHNFHSFGYRLLRNHRDELGLSRNSDLLDQVGQRLLLRSLRPQLKHFLYHPVGRYPNAVDRFADVISRAKDELVTPSDYHAFAAGKRAAFDFRYGLKAHGEAVESLRRREAEDRLWQVKLVRRELSSGGDTAEKVAFREARRDASGDGRATWWNQLSAGQQSIANGLKPTYLRDAEALEVLRLEEEAEVYERYQAELQRRGQLDFGEQMSRTIQLLLDRPNIASRYQSQFRHVLVDEFQDANMAQILLLELVGRGPDKPDNVVVVGDDDQSIYRFRGASYAAFARFRERFGKPPTWAADRTTPAVASLPLLQNRRSTANVLTAAGRLIDHNQGRLKDGQPLRSMKEPGEPVEVVYAADEADEADQVVQRIRAAFETLPEPRRWGDIAVLYRRHAHRKQILDRLRRAGIPYAVVGATGLFLQPEIRDVEAALRVLASPSDSVSFTRLMTAGPWRFDASEILRVRKLADFDGRPMFESASQIRREAEEAVGDGGDVGTPLRLKLARLLDCLDDLVPRAMREGPYTLLEEYLVRTNLLHDLIALETPDAQRQVLAVARLMRFAADWQREHPRESLSDFVAYLDVYQEVGGDLDADGPASVQVEGVQLMTIYQAKGLEYEVVIVPRLIEGQFPDTRADTQLIPVELLKQKPPEQFEVDEERRLLFVAMTRARRQLVLTTISAPQGARERPGRFTEEVAPESEGGATPPDVFVTRRQPAAEAEVEVGDGVGGRDGSPGPTADQAAQVTTAVLERLMPVPAPFERRYALRRRAVEIIGALEQLLPGDEAGRAALLTELVTVASQAAGQAEEARRNGLDPMTLRVLSQHAPAGRTLLQMAPAPETFSHSQFRAYLGCPLSYAFERIYRIPNEETKGFFEFGSAVHAAFEAFSVARWDAAAAGAPAPGFALLRAEFDAVWQPLAVGDVQQAEHFRARSEPALRRFFDRELASLAQAVAFEQEFLLELPMGGGEEPLRVKGFIDRIDRHPDGSIEVTDYKTGKTKSQADADADDQLSTYALALARGAVPDHDSGEPLPAASRLTLYFTESDTARSTTRTQEQLDEFAAKLVAVARRIRGGDFTATPGFKTCEWCDYRRICPSRWGED